VSPGTKERGQTPKIAVPLIVSKQGKDRDENVFENREDAMAGEEETAYNSRGLDTRRKRRYTLL